MPKKFFHSTFLSVLSRPQQTILSAVVVIAGARLVSAVLGLVRDRLLADRFVPHTLGIYWAADRIPSFIFNLVVVGALASTFVPVFTRLLKRSGREEAFRVASSVVNLALLVFSGLAVLVIILARPLSLLIAPVGTTPADLEILINLTRLLFSAQLFLLLSNFLTSLLQSFRRFVIPALAPVVYNAGVVGGILILTPVAGIYAPAWGTVLGASLHLAIQFPLARALGLRYFGRIDLRRPGVVWMWKLIVPRLFGLTANQIGALVGTVLAASISFASVTFLTFAQHLQNLPLGLVGGAWAQAALPTLAEESIGGDLEKFKTTLVSSFHQLVFLISPIAVTLFVLRLPAVRLAFGASQFDWNATVATGYVVAFLALSIFAQAAAFLLVQAFYALCDTATPVRIGIVSVTLNVGLGYLCVGVLETGVWGVALGATVAAFVNFGLLLFFLDRKVGGFDLWRLWQPFFRVAAAALGMAISIYVPLKFLDRGAWGSRFPIPGVSLPATFDLLILDTRYTINLIWLTLISAGFGSVVYFSLAWILHVPPARRLVKAALKISGGL